MFKKSESIGKLAMALSKAQGQMRTAKKNADNPFFKSSYANLESVVNTAKKPLSDNELSYIQSPGKTTIEYVETMRNNQKVVLEKATLELTTLIMHSSGEWQESTLTMPIDKYTPQGFGSAIAYARRYALSAALGIAAGDDDDGNDSSNKNQGQGKKKAPKKPIAKPAPEFDDLKSASNQPSDAMTKKFHATGKDLYKNEWDTRRPELVHGATKKRTKSSTELTKAEMKTLIDGMSKRLRDIEPPPF